VARDIVPRVLEERGARVDVVVAYETALPEFAPSKLDELLTPVPDLITFTSSSTATHFARLLGKCPINEALAEVAIASIGPITSATLRKLGARVTLEARESTATGLVRAITEYFRGDAK